MTVRPHTQTNTGQTPLLVAGSLFAVLLAGLALIDAKAPGSTTLGLSVAQLGRAARLFHGPLPYLTSLPAFSFTVVAWSSVAVLWGVYLWLIWHVRDRQIDLRWVAGGAIGLSLLAVLIPPLFSTDIFSYAMFGRLAGVYDVNPYLTTASNSASGDPLLPYVFWRDIASPYGPLWSLLSWLVAHGARTTPFMLVVRFKLLAFGCVMLDGALIYRFVRFRWPEQATWAYLSFAWNPLVLLDGIVVGHNDMLILTLVLISAELLRRHHSTWGMVWLTASALIKYSTVPVVGVAMIREALRRPLWQRGAFMARVGTLVLPLAAVSFLPFWAGPRSLASTFVEPDRGVTNPIWRVPRWIARHLVSHQYAAFTNPTPIVVLAFIAFAAWQVVALRKQGTRVTPESIHDDLAVWAQTLVVFLLLWPRLHTWYPLVPLGLALAAGPNHRRLYGQVLVLTALSYLAYI